MYSRSSFQIPHDYSFYIGTADQNWFNVVVFNLGLLAYTQFLCLKIFPLHNFQKRDCRRILAHTFGIGLVLLMFPAPVSYPWNESRLAGITSNRYVLLIGRTLNIPG